MSAELMKVPETVSADGKLWWQRGPGAKERVNLAELPIRFATDWSPNSASKNYAGVKTTTQFIEFAEWHSKSKALNNEASCLYEMIEELSTPTRLGVRCLSESVCSPP